VRLLKIIALQILYLNTDSLNSHTNFNQKQTNSRVNRQNMNKIFRVQNVTLLQPWLFPLEVL